MRAVSLAAALGATAVIGGPGPGEESALRAVRAPAASLAAGDDRLDPIMAAAIDAGEAGRINAALDAGRRIIVVGTTTTRALESAALDGGGRVRAGGAETALFIHPGHRFLVAGGLVTNFHLPASSLLLLVAAFAGRDTVLRAYREAVAERYHFYSYGDAMLVA